MFFLSLFLSSVRWFFSFFCQVFFPLNIEPGGDLTRLHNKTFQDSCCLPCCRGGGEFIELPAEELSTIDRSLFHILVCEFVFDRSHNPLKWKFWFLFYLFLLVHFIVFNWTRVQGQRSSWKGGWGGGRKEIAGQVMMVGMMRIMMLMIGPRGWWCWWDCGFGNFLHCCEMHPWRRETPIVWKSCQTISVNKLRRWGDANPTNREMSKSLFNVRSRWFKSIQKKWPPFKALEYHSIHYFWIQISFRPDGEDREAPQTPLMKVIIAMFQSKLMPTLSFRRWW